LIDVIGVNLERTAASTAFFSIRRSEENGVVDADTRRRCALIAPHVRRAVAIGKLVQTEKSTGIMLKAALDRVAAAVVFVTGKGKIIFANHAAEELFQDKKVLVSRRGLAGAVDPAADRLLRDAFAAAERGDAALGLKGIDIPLAGHPEGHHYVANVLSVTSDARRMSDMGTAVAALFVRRITLASQSPLEVVGRRYKLTPSELRVLAAVLEAGSVENIAERLGVSKSTVKTHLKHVLAKTGTRRQTDLIRLVVGGGV
jgi:DNA-binding CsgD family transcriptional regulator